MYINTGSQLKRRVLSSKSMLTSLFCAVILLANALFITGLPSGGLNAAEPAKNALPKDVLNSIMWKSVATDYLLSDKNSNGTIIMNDAVKVVAPKVAEDQLNVPVSVDATAVKNVRKIIVVADLNPLPEVLTYEPLNAAARISFRIKVDQGTPVRAAVLDAEGVWHVGGTYLDASGGGCSQPAQAYKTDNWVERLTEVRAKIWRRLGAEQATLRFTIRHPMDTGLADGIPAFYIEQLNLTDGTGNPLGRLTVHEPVSENPTITVYPHLKQAMDKIEIKGRDNEGNLIKASVPVPVTSTRLQTSE